MTPTGEFGARSGCEGVGVMAGYQRSYLHFPPGMDQATLRRFQGFLWANVYSYPVVAHHPSGKPQLVPARGLAWSNADADPCGE